jgi:hypothetical protein
MQQMDSLLVSLLNVEGVTSLVQQVAPVQIIINEITPLTIPFITYQSNINHCNRKATQAVLSFHYSNLLDVVSTTYQQNIDIQEAIFTAIDGYHDNTTPFINLDSTVWIPDELGYHCQLTYAALIQLA